MCKVKLVKNHLDVFRRMARKSPLEIQAYLVGEVVSPSLTVIDRFAYTSEYGTQTRGKVAWYRADYDRVQREAEERGRRIVGQIHSHPNWDAVMSSDDFNVCIAGGLRICGIVSTDGRKTRARFWVMDSPVPCDIVYAKKKIG